MTISKSRGFILAEAGLELATKTATTIGVTAASKIFTDSGSGLVAAGFATGYELEVHGAANATINANKYTISGVSAGGGTITVLEALDANESAGASITLRSVKRGSFNDLFFDSVLIFYSGSKPASANATENGTELVRFEDIRFGNAQWDSTNLQAYVDLFGSTPISATASASGTAAWARLYGGGAVVTGASPSAVRMDGSIGVGTGDIQLSSTTITSGAVETLSSVKYKVNQVGV